jgi:AcrR family transcriptional regulator
MTEQVVATPRPGRQRDPMIDEAVMYVALEHLAKHGIGGFSIAAVAAEAGTTRPAIYRRWNGKIELLIAAVAWLAVTEPPVRTGAPYADLVREMEHFRHCISDIGAISLAGVMITDGVERPIRDTYHEQIARPRWERIGACLRSAVEAGQLPPGTDIELATSMLTGSWYAFAWSGEAPEPDWPRRVTDAAWRSLGGDPEAAAAALEDEAPAAETA